MTADAWLDGVIQRHSATMPRPQWLKAIRALSARYVERRDTIAHGGSIDSAGKRAAFAGFYAPLHFLTVTEVLRSIGTASVSRVFDAGCGTGVAGAAWALQLPRAPALHGIDLQTWALAEARANWRELGLSGRSERGDFVRALERLARERGSADGQGAILGWSLNELPAPNVELALLALQAVAARGAAILVIEPIARGVTPWWPRLEALAAGASRSDEWRFEAALPAALARAARDAGLTKAELTARTLAWNWRSA